MLTGIDHIVVAVRDLEEAKKSYELLGFTVVPGGRHPVGTHNGLISLADGSYIELIAFYERNPNHRWWAPLQKGEGLVDFYLATTDLEADIAKLRSGGVEIDDPQPLTRTRPDGYRLRWLISLPREGFRGVVASLIRDETPRDERVPRDKIHKNGAIGVGTVTVAVLDPAVVRRWYEAVLGDDSGTEIERDDLKAAGVRFKIGPHLLDFVKPAGPESPLERWLRLRGPSPYAVTLRSSFKNPIPLNTALTHGARLSFE